MNTTYWEDIKQSLYNVINNVLLEQGAFLNISLGMKDKHNNDLSKLFCVSDPRFPVMDGQLWQSAFHNWNYQTGVNNPLPPTVFSGVYYNGVFIPKDDTMHVDYENGRIFFDSPFPTTGVMQAEFAIKEYSFLSPSSEKEAVHETQFVINDDKTGRDIFPADPTQIYLPALFVEVEDGTEKGFQFGGATETMPTIKINIISDRRQQLEAIASVLMHLSTKSFPIVPASNGPKFDFFNDVIEPYSFGNWSTLSRNFAYIKSVKYNRFFTTKQESKEPHLFGGVALIEILAIR